MTRFSDSVQGDVTRLNGEATRPIRGLETGERASASSWLLAGKRIDGAETLRLWKPDQREETMGRLGEDGMEWGEQGIKVSELVALLRRCDAEKELARVFRENPVAKHEGTERPFTVVESLNELLNVSLSETLALKGKCVLMVAVASITSSGSGDMRVLLAEDNFELSVDVVIVIVVEAVKISSAEETGDSSRDSQLLPFARSCPSGRVSQEAIGASFGFGSASWKFVG